MNNTLTIERLPEGIRVTPAPTAKASRVPALKSVITRAFVAHAVNGALKALDAPGNPFTTEFPNTFR